MPMPFSALYQNECAGAPYLDHLSLLVQMEKHANRESKQKRAESHINREQEFLNHNVLI